MMGTEAWPRIDPAAQARLGSPCSWPACEQQGPCNLNILCRRKWERNEVLKSEEDAE